MKTLTSLVLAASMTSCTCHDPKIKYDSEEGYTVKLPPGCKEVSSFNEGEYANLTCKDAHEHKSFYVHREGKWHAVQFEYSSRVDVPETLQSVPLPPECDNEVIVQKYGDYISLGCPARPYFAMTNFHSVGYKIIFDPQLEKCAK